MKYDKKTSWIDKWVKHDWVFDKEQNSLEFFLGYPIAGTALLFVVTHLAVGHFSGGSAAESTVRDGLYYLNVIERVGETWVEVPFGVYLFWLLGRWAFAGTFLLGFVFLAVRVARNFKL